MYYIDDDNKKRVVQNKSTVRQNQVQNQQSTALNQTPLFENSSGNNQVIVKSTGEVNLNSSIMVHYDEKTIQQMAKKADVCEPVSTRVQKPMYFNFSYSPNTNVTTKLFVGTADDLNKCLEKTKLKGQGQAFLDAQNKYGINALFLMSIAKVESGYGAKPKTYCKYNVVGAVGQKPKSYAACIDSLGRNLNTNYVTKGHTTIAKIRDKYCSSNKAWPKLIAEEMNNLNNQINRNLSM